MKQKGRPYARHVLYVDLPQGQVSFHSRVKYDGPEYGGDWDGKYKSEERIVEFADAVVARSVANTTVGLNRPVIKGGGEQQGGLP